MERLTTCRVMIAAVLLSAGAINADPPPSVTLPIVGGGSVRTGDYRGRLLVLDLWATWCAPCLSELTDLDAYVAAHAQAVAAVAVLAERRPDPRLVAARVGALRMPVALRPAGNVFPLANNAVPTTYILDRDGRVVLRKAGAFAPGELRARLDALIAPVGPAARGR